MAGRVGSAPDRGASAVAYVGLGVLGAGTVLGLHQAGYVDALAGDVRSGICGVLRDGDCRADPGGPPPTGVRHGTGAQPGESGWSGVGRRPESIPHLSLPLMAGGAAVFVLFWWGVPGRLRARFRRAPQPVSRRRMLQSGIIGRAADAPAPDPGSAPVAAGGPAGSPAGTVAIAGIDPGIAGKGMRVGVRNCQITLRPGPKGTVRLDKTLARTGDREFELASRTVRRSLRDPAFVATLIEETGRAAAYLDDNPQLTGAAARRAELAALTGALEGIGRGPSG